MLLHGASCDCGRCRRERRNRGTQALAAAIALKGGQLAQSTFVANWAPYCDTPVELFRRITSREAVDELHAMEVSALVPCRRCTKCLQWRQMKWRERAIFEILRSNRTWFITLTFAPIHLAGILVAAKGSEPKEVEAAAYPHVQRFIKRLRKHGHEFRYLAIYERGEVTGRSHYHLFLHEIGAKPVHKTDIERQWRSYTHVRLVRGEESGGAASYLTKYATKHFDIRPRASARYGKLPSPPKPKVLGVSNI